MASPSFSKTAFGLAMSCLLRSPRERYLPVTTLSVLPTVHQTHLVAVPLSSEYRYETFHGTATTSSIAGMC